jgi:putative aldouronate transport system permease protein
MVKHGLDDIIFDTLNTIFMLLVLIVVAYPLYFVIVASISEPYQVASGNVRFLPKGFTLDAYRNVLENMDVWLGYRNSIFYTAAGTFFSLFLTLPTAYVLSKKKLPGRFFLSWFFLFTMYFSGGLIPMYLLIHSIGLLNRPYTLVILGAFSVFNMIITRSYYQTSIPEELYEAAEIDGAGQIRVFCSVALPLSAPIIAVMALYYGVAQWNGFFNALVYVSEREYMPLQIILRNILIYSQTALQQITQGMEESEILAAAKLAYMAEAMKYALIIIASFPLLVSYTFVQKHFIKGIMVGSLKA